MFDLRHDLQRLLCLSLRENDHFHSALKWLTDAQIFAQKPLTFRKCNRLYFMIS